MTQEFKSIEEIKEEVAREHGYRDFATMYYDEEVEIPISEVAQRYAQQYIDANKELVDEIENLHSIDSLRRGVVKDRDEKIKDLKHSNKELVEMLERVEPLLRERYLYATASDVRELLSKHTTHDKGKEKSC